MTKPTRTLPVKNLNIALYYDVIARECMQPEQIAYRLVGSGSSMAAEIYFYGTPAQAKQTEAIFAWNYLFELP